MSYMHGWRGGLVGSSLGASFGRLRRLSADLPRKNRWTIAEHAGDATPDEMQHLLGGPGVVWAHSAAALRRSPRT